LECEDLWVFRLAHSILTASAPANFAVISVVDPHSASNWVREVPVTVQIAAGSLDWAPAGATPAPVSVWIVTATEEAKRTVAYIARDGRGLLKQSVTTDDSHLDMLRLG